MDAALIRSILDAIPWSVPYAEPERDAEIVAELIRAALRDVHDQGPVTIDVLRSVFYRNKGAYLVGRVRRGRVTLPLVIPLLRAERGIVVDAALLNQDRASVVFGFSWSYFRVEVPRPRDLIDFLRTIMPFKRIDELYIAIGFNKHGKTELFREPHAPPAAFRGALCLCEGDEGMVMAVFTLPSFNVVFKVIKDRFAAPKNTTRKAVMEKYHFVFVRDRVGRLADAQEFEHLEFPRRCFPDDLLEYLLRVAGGTVRVDGRPSRRATRLHRAPRHARSTSFSRDAGESAAARHRDRLRQRHQGPRRGRHFHRRHAAQEFRRDAKRAGHLLRLRRAVPALRVQFRRDSLSPDRSRTSLPRSRGSTSGEHDIFPEEFQAFLAPAGPVRQAFLDAHADLFDVEFWKGAQDRLARGEVLDVFPYPRNESLSNGR